MINFCHLCLWIVWMVSSVIRLWYTGLLFFWQIWSSKFQGISDWNILNTGCQDVEHCLKITLSIITFRSHPLPQFDHISKHYRCHSSLRWLPLVQCSLIGMDITAGQGPFLTVSNEPAQSATSWFCFLKLKYKVQYVLKYRIYYKCTCVPIFVKRKYFPMTWAE